MEQTFNIIRLDHADSTNSWLTANRNLVEAPVLVYAVEQEAGRGQRGNSWESEPGKNLTASALFHPEGVHPREQFAISEAVALAVVDLLGECGVEATVKWPNDIYVGDRKICGILIEHAILPDSILYTIAGIGVNINQREFRSDAPNPVSLIQLTEMEEDVDDMAVRLAQRLKERIAATETPEGREVLHEEFMARLYRGDGGFYPFFDRLAGERIEAAIADVAPDGTMTLLLKDTPESQGSSEPKEPSRRSYLFKEVEFILTN